MRFEQHRVEARKDIGATGKHAVIEITDERVIRPKRSGQSAAPAMSPTPPSAGVDKRGPAPTRCQTFRRTGGAESPTKVPTPATGGACRQGPGKHNGSGEP